MEDDRVQLLVEGEAGPLTENLSLPRLLLGPFTPEERAALPEAVLGRFTDGFEVALDGRRAAPRLVELVTQDGPPEDRDWRTARIVLEYEAVAPPRAVSLTWDSFKGEKVEFIPVTIRRTRRGVPERFALWPDEPQHVWHAADLRPPRRPQVQAVTDATPRTLPIPVPSLALAAAAAVALAWSWRARPARRPASGAVLAAAGALVLAVLLRDRGLAHVPWPGTTRPALPSPEVARSIFERLHQNIYRAFDAESEGRVYDLLAACVDGALLDDLYAEVYESLILREQGGAVCVVEDVLVEDGRVLDVADGAGGAPEFRADWTWRVKGVVNHWGHEHRRTNRYRATYLVRHDGTSWKIVAVTVAEHERSDDA